MELRDTNRSRAYPIYKVEMILGLIALRLNLHITLSSFERTTLRESSDDGEEATPVPMPNTEVKLFSADGSWGLPPARVGRC